MIFSSSLSYVSTNGSSNFKPELSSNSTGTSAATSPSPRFLLEDRDFLLLRRFFEGIFVSGSKSARKSVYYGRRRTKLETTHKRINTHSTHTHMFVYVDGMIPLDEWNDPIREGKSIITKLSRRITHTCAMKRELRWERGGVGVRERKRREDAVRERKEGSSKCCWPALWHRNTISQSGIMRKKKGETKL